MDTYDFASKHLYRARRESAIDRMAPGNSYTRRVAYLDTGEALDTIAYLRRGYRPENLWAINRNPAEVAQLTKTLDRQNLPHVNTIGLDFEDALTRRVPEVDVIDFDGMSCLSDKILEMFRRILANRKCVYGVTLLAGRELGIFGACAKSGNGKMRTSFNTLVNNNHGKRLATFFSNLKGNYEQKCWCHFERILWDSYLSLSGQQMVWCVFNVNEHRELDAKYIINTLGTSEILPVFNCLRKCVNRFNSKNKNHMRAMVICSSRLKFHTSLRIASEEYLQAVENKDEKWEKISRESIR